jgi:hypothetical protein
MRGAYSNGHCEAVNATGLSYRQTGRGGGQAGVECDQALGPLVDRSVTLPKTITAGELADVENETAQAIREAVAQGRTYVLWDGLTNCRR